jgi:hypothetical protein
MFLYSELCCSRKLSESRENNKVDSSSVLGYETPFEMRRFWLWDLNHLKGRFFSGDYKYKWENGSATGSAKH